ncbi:MAG: hypothetical protein NTV02_03145 [Candidatus Zambryskibacteria bacterium]|nr:hypothetical protein [Candidatus Zambryskibacteria bacterium]
MELSININTVVSLGLSQRYQGILERKWSATVSDPFAFTPHEKKGVVTLEDVLRENNALGDFSSQQMRNVFGASTINDRLNRMRAGKKIVAVGFGRNYDACWLAEAILAGYEVWWLDVSSAACEMAFASMRAQLEKLKAHHIHFPKPRVVQGEIRSVLANPTSIGLDLETVEIWYFCRTLTCMSTRSMMFVLKWIGESSFSEAVDPDKKKMIQIVVATRDYNITRVEETSKLYTLKQLLAPLERGAGRKMTVTSAPLHMYFDQKYSALSIRAR